MACFHPRTVWRSSRFTHPKSGKPRFRFKKPLLWYREDFKSFDPATGKPVTPKEFYNPEEMQIPGCKPQCVGCQEAYSRSWAVRCWHESQRHDLNCFITLTFNDKYLPKRGLDHRYFQLFMKRLRRLVSGDVGASSRSIRFYMAGEYGSQFFRPHFHACIFGYDFPDRKMFTMRGDVQLDTSDTLSGLWSVPMRGSLKDYPDDAVRGESFGFCSVGDVTFASAAYVARYISKKIRGDEADSHYQGRKPEYTKMSLKPGIARDWFLAYKDSVFPDDAVSLRDGGKCKVPRYYDKIFELYYPEQAAKIKSLRVSRASSSPHNTPERLRAREKVKQAQLNQLKRSL